MTHLPRALAPILIALLTSVGAPLRGFAATNLTDPLWHEQKIKNYLPDMTWPEVQDPLGTP